MTAKHMVRIFHPEIKGKLPFVVVNSGHGEADDLYDLTKSLTNKDFVLIMVETENWNDDLSPWKAEAVFPNGALFEGHADQYLDSLLNEILPDCEERLKEEGIIPSSYILAGYSLAGLFALYAATQTDRFHRIVSASGSLWYPGFEEFMEKERISDNTDLIYLSLGDKEANTRHPLMSQVEKKTASLAKKLPVETYYELNPGDHFTDPDLRLAKGISYVLNK